MKLIDLYSLLHDIIMENLEENENINNIIVTSVLYDSDKDSIEVDIEIDEEEK